MANTTILVERDLARLEGDASALNGLLSVAFRRLRWLAHEQLCGFPGLRQAGEQTDDVTSAAMMRLASVLGEVKPKNARQFFGLAALEIRRELLTLQRRHFGPPGLARLQRLGLDANAMASAWAALEAEAERLIAACQLPANIRGGIRRGRFPATLLDRVNDLPQTPPTWHTEAVARWWGIYGPGGARRPVELADAEPGKIPAAASDDWESLLDALPADRQPTVLMLLRDELTQWQVAWVFWQLERQCQTPEHAAAVKRGAIPDALQSHADRLITAARARHFSAEERQLIESKERSVKRWWACARDLLAVRCIDQLERPQAELADLLCTLGLAESEARDALKMADGKFRKLSQITRLAIARAIRERL